MKWKQAALVVLGGLALLPGGPAAAGPGSFGQTSVRGITIEAPPRTLYSDPDLLTTDRICGTFGDASDLIQAGVGLAVSMANAEIQRRIDGVQLVRTYFRPSTQCSAVATLGPNNTSLSIRIELPGNRFETNVTTPDASILGADIGLPQGADPRLYTTFDVHANITIPLPGQPGQCLGNQKSSVSIDNIALPKGMNFTGNLVGFLVDVGTSIYDHFKNGELGKTLGGGFQARAGIPNGAISAINNALCGGTQYGTIVNGLGSNEQLLISLGTGQKIVDPRCIDGYVWRTVRPDDLVCVTPDVRAQVRADNAAAADRRIGPPDHSALVMCQITGNCASAFKIACKPGYVWREAVANDYVCVTPQTRAQARDDNSWAPRRRRDYEPVIH